MVQQFTTNMALEEVLEAQDRGDLTINDTFRMIDAILFGTVIDERNTPPGSPTAYSDIYAVGNSPSGAWVGHNRERAFWDGVEWKFITVARGQVYFDVAREALYHRDTLTASEATERVVALRVGKDWATLSATRTEYLAVIDVPKATIEAVELVSTTATTSDGSNKWTFQITNVTQSNNLLASAADTNGALGDLAVDTRKTITPDQNTQVVDGDVLELVATKTGSPGDPTRLHVQLKYSRG
jgi:hypothetical protein